MSRQPVSVCIITLNEEKRLGRCLESVAWADEIVVVDSHSTDRTREIAADAGARVIEHNFAGYIGQKNFALSQATHEWVLSLDADEELSPELRTSVLAALESPGDSDGFRFNRIHFLLGRWRRHGGWYPNCKLRLFRRRLAGISQETHPCINQCKLYPIWLLIYLQGRIARSLRVGCHIVMQLPNCAAYRSQGWSIRLV